MTRLINKILYEERVPTEWKISEIVSIFKQKGGMWKLQRSQAAGTCFETVGKGAGKEIERIAAGWLYAVWICEGKECHKCNLHGETNPFTRLLLTWRRHMTGYPGKSFIGAYVRSW